MRPIASIPEGEARALRGVIFDLDDTLLDHGALTEAAYGALFRLREAGLRLIACTGRPAGWGEVIQRQWPIDATVVENGALGLVFDEIPGGGRKVRALDRRSGDRTARRAALLRLAEALAARFPETAIADDNAARITDVTLDIGEHRRVPAPIVAEMRRIAAAEGARTVASSVHLHLADEAEDKASGAIALLSGHFGEDATSSRSRYAFVGDSGNDAAAFAAFRLTLAVANVRPHLHALSVPPRFVSQAPMGRGFAEIAAHLVELRAGCRKKT